MFRWFCRGLICYMALLKKKKKKKTFIYSMYIIYIFFWPADEVPPDILIEKPRIKQKFPLKNAYLRYN